MHRIIMLCYSLLLLCAVGFSVALWTENASPSRQEDLLSAYAQGDSTFRGLSLSNEQITKVELPKILAEIRQQRTKRRMHATVMLVLVLGSNALLFLGHKCKTVEA